MRRCGGILGPPRTLESEHLLQISTRFVGGWARETHTSSSVCRVHGICAGKVKRQMDSELEAKALLLAQQAAAEEAQSMY